MDRKTRKLMAMSRALHPMSDVDRTNNLVFFIKNAFESEEK